MAHLYTAHANVSGGREGHGRTDDGRLDVKLARPGAMGGENVGTNPEQLFAVGYGACFEGALATVARRRKVKLGQTSVISMVSLHSVEDGSFRIEAALDIEVPDVDDDNLVIDLVREADMVCPYSNALRGNVDVAISANGLWVKGPREFGERSA
ncbi:organic hydroperoxide resistance protein [Ruicaihuangia caeni]|uniref:Organic hydroperoxide resistance protein n=1 Tax=Ruicaihuangia caeni TaxID=3042517 RepID=A0AAW6T8Q8_9MICO|nr:organic hydroperoxide resistance protein [Klugiella sp. YN-L-19]MDI2099146.1 organic hydroperoxide resistance protein [Klugiella sp. YN-L-19]